MAAPPVARRFPAIQSWKRLRFTQRLGRLPTSGHVLGPVRLRDRRENQRRYADMAAVTAKVIIRVSIMERKGVEGFEILVWELE